MFKRQRKEPETVAANPALDEDFAEVASHLEPVKSQPPTPTADARITAMIGASIKIKGEISGNENLIIDGEVEGRVDLGSHDLTIGTSGDVKANLTGKSIQINGSVTGDIESSELAVVSKSGRVTGNIVSPRVTLEDGAQFKGSIDMGPIDEKSSKPLATSYVATHPSAIDNEARPEAVA